MKKIDIEKWNGKKHYLWFKDYAHPYYGITSRIDITKFYSYIKEHNLPFFSTFMYVITKALNEIEEFRLRIVDEDVVLYDVISPAFTVMTNKGIYDNCDVEMDQFPKYLKEAKKRIELTKQGLWDSPNNYFEENRKDQFYISCVPWIDYTSVSHPMTDDKKDTIPRIGWGKYIYEEDKVLISLSIQVHHALIDGYPLSLGFLKIQEMLNSCELYLK